MTSFPTLAGRYVRAIAVAAVVIFLGLVVRFWHPVYGFTSFLQLDAIHASRSIAEFRDYPIFVYRYPGAYDGFQYAQIAYHPLLTAGELRPAIDNLAYRGRRILMPVLAWLLAGAQPALIVHVYTLLNVACWLILAALLWRLLPVNGTHGLVAWAGLLFSAGVLGSVRLALTDLPALALVAAALWSAEKAMQRSAVGWLAAAALARETSLAAWPGLCTGPWKSPAANARNLLRALLAAAPLAAWLLYIRWRIGPPNQGWSNFTWPVTGFLGKWRDCFITVARLNDQPLAWTTLLATAGLTFQALFILTRPRPANLWWRVGAVYTLIMMCLGPAVWEDFPGAAMRVLLPLNLACNVLALRTRASLAWLVPCNLTACAGLQLMWIPSRDPQEAAAVRQNGLACVMWCTDGWSPYETHDRDIWFWSGTASTLKFEAWPHRSNITIRLSAEMRSLAPRTVVAYRNGREIWRGAVGLKRTHLEFPPLLLADGRTELTLITDTPGIPENAAPNARRLGFALYDPVFSVTEAKAATP